MGSFVPNVADPAFTWGDLVYSGTGSELTKELVESKFNTSISTAEDMLERLVGEDGNSGYLGALNSVIEDFEAPVITPMSVTAPALGITPDSRPMVDLGTLDTDFPTFSTSPPSLSELPTVDLSSLNPADLPDEITAAISWLEQSHDVSLFTDLLSRILNDIQSGATGLDATVEQDIYDRAVARQDIEDARIQSETEDYFAARGFDLPPGAMAGRLLEQANEISRNRTELNGKIAEDQARLAQTNSQFVITAAKDLEAVLRDFTNKRNDRNLDYAKAVAANAISLYAEQIRAYLASAEANKIYVEVQVENLRAGIERQKGLVDLFSAEADAYGKEVEAIAKKNEAITEAFKAEVVGYEAETKAISENQRILLDEYLAKLQSSDIDIRAAIANADNVLKGYSSESALRERIAESMANIAMQSVASSYGMVNMNASLSHGTSRSESESTTHAEGRSMSYGKGESLTESHDYKHDTSS